MIINLIGFACLGHLIADLLSRSVRLPDKPFKCNMCMSFWLSIGPFFVMYGVEALMLSSIAAIISETIYKVLQ